MSLCPLCFTYFPDRSTAGHPSVYCSNACACKAYRLRRKALNVGAPKKPRASKKRFLEIGGLPQLVNLEKPGRYENAAGSVFKFPVVEIKPVSKIENPIRTFADLVDFFNE